MKLEYVIMPYMAKGVDKLEQYPNLDSSAAAQTRSRFFNLLLCRFKRGDGDLDAGDTRTLILMRHGSPHLTFPSELIRLSEEVRANVSTAERFIFAKTIQIRDGISERGMMDRPVHVFSTTTPESGRTAEIVAESLDGELAVNFEDKTCIPRTGDGMIEGFRQSIDRAIPDATVLFVSHDETPNSLGLIAPPGYRDNDAHGSFLFVDGFRVPQPR